MTGQIKITPTPKQKEAKRLLDKVSVLVYGGGIRGGKSYFLIYTILTFCFQYDKSRWLILRKDLPTLKRNLFPTFQAIIDNGFNQYIESWNQTTQVVTFTNGSQIIFMAESFDTDKELNRFRGLEINGGAIDEINEVQEQTFYKVIERSGSWTGAGKVPIKIIGTCNPSHGWVKEQFYDKHKNGTLKPSWAFISALITDNPYIEPEYLQSLKDNMPKYQYAVFVDGNWDMKLEGVLFADDELKKFSLKTLNPDGLECVYAYADIADEGDDYLCMVFAKIYKGKVFITNVVYSQDTINITVPQCAALHNHLKCNYARIETNNAGGGFLRDYRKLIPIAVNALAVHSQTNKVVRIFNEYKFITEYFYFLNNDEYAVGSDYDKYMRAMLSYMKDGSSKHDDAPDATAGLSRMIQSFPSKELFR
ncbi:phage_term_2, phage terminase, large subunit, PBSX family [uncultured Caudovirales phage]|uniref:Phage_term_2, phage terminase, large subunit, PBSX family n=1 Tax=uncultured Caudovirales phage TaxID=2100421 RepID=A0A6J5SI41_9CAUD|nr:phage_term_2, phage terminase, large subunit, PBSX family [uncultured Caudovirales phage]CAB4171485.1 phage_term_2, phage terminase, large subunit, PBSX family [uncultured Caudovirales phage]CAB4177301.1 phage_term_2, phage terminase, large subunit, PBSX family [uncultured Caudovirales phage]CAB4199564.1 phage_term_2, phage terminase, large subunit, PBSX family [uncultured Caudovirales phage]CAB4213555.1 phage_term_2, phage terminase, large subunit, PBSX family [uncultured Caudovirales phage